jgi:beta-lactamase class A
MSLSSLCRAVLIRSDNTAANVLLDTVGGPGGVTRFARLIGDTVTRLDRTELAVNEALAGDPRDTTTPAAMARNLNEVLLGATLTGPARDQLRRWMEESITGRDRLRARLPADWRAADKTGANGEHTSNDIAVLWPPGRAPLVVTAYITQCSGPESKRAAMLADIGELVRTTLG